MSSSLSPYLRRTRPLQRNQFSRIFFNRVTFLRSCFFSQFFVDEIPPRYKKRGLRLSQSEEWNQNKKWGKRNSKKKGRKVNSHSSTHNPRSIRIHRDIVFCHFHGICLRQTAHGPFGCAVMREKGKRFESDNGRTLETGSKQEINIGNVHRLMVSMRGVRRATDIHRSISQEIPA